MGVLIEPLGPTLGKFGVDLVQRQSLTGVNLRGRMVNLREALGSEQRIETLGFRVHVVLKHDGDIFVDAAKPRFGSASLGFKIESIFELDVSHVSTQRLEHLKLLTHTRSPR